MFSHRLIQAAEFYFPVQPLATSISELSLSKDFINIKLVKWASSVARTNIGPGNKSAFSAENPSLNK